MANKRMFTMKICDSDAFLDMPLSTQCLYFHLNMRADDDGFIGNPKRISRLVGASEDDLNLLIAKRFLLIFEDGVIVIKHWRMHNTLAKNRYHETQYLDEKRMLKLKDNGSYSFDSGTPLDDSSLVGMFKNSDSKKLIGEQAENKRRTNGEHSENADIDLGLDIDIDLDKDKDKELDTDIELKKNTELNKDIDTEGNISAPEVAENVPDEPVAPRERIDYTSIMNLYNSICVSFPVCRNLSDNRKKMIKACFKNGIKEEDFERAFRLSEDSPFLKGMNNRGWSANFDWIIKPNNIVKILDGNYTQNTNTPTKQNFAPNSGSSDSLEDFYSMASEWANKG